VGRDSLVDIATWYGPNSPEFEFRWGEIFCAVQTGHGAYPASYTMGIGSLSRGVKRPGRGVNHPSSSSTEVKERAELYLDYSSRNSCPVLGRTLPSICLRTSRARVCVCDCVVIFNTCVVIVFDHSQSCQSLSNETRPVYFHGYKQFRLYAWLSATAVYENM
jgi:hypothetical protein